MELQLICCLKITKSALQELISSVFYASLLLHLLEHFVSDATAAQWTKLLIEWKILV